MLKVGCLGFQGLTSAVTSHGEILAGALDDGETIPIVSGQPGAYDVGGTGQATENCISFEPVVREQESNPVRAGRANAEVQCARKTARRFLNQYPQVRPFGL